MSKFKLNKKYNHKSDMVFDAFHIDEKRADFVVDKVGEYWYSLTPEKFMISKILDFIEQQDWTLIEKLYATERFSKIHQEEMTFGEYNEELLDFIISEWKKKGTVTDEEETREYLKHMFKLLMGYNLDCLIDTLKDIDNLAEKFNEEDSDDHEETVLTLEEIEAQKKTLSINNAIRSIDSAIPNSLGFAIFTSEGYDIISKNPEAAKFIQDTLKAGQKGFITKIKEDMRMYQ
jgi:hypothetical protein